MIALFQIALPYDLLILPGEELQLLQYEGDAGIDGIEAFEVLVGPPYRSRLSEDQSGGIVRDPDLFNPADPQPIDPNVEVGGIEPVRCDAIAVRIVAANFDRRQQTAAANVRALIVVVCDAVNGLLQRLRVLARATHIKPLTPDTLIYRVVLLDDSGALVEAEDGKWRQLGTASFRIRHTAVTPAIWQELSDLGEYEAPPWDELLLDAMDLDVELGPSLVLAATAVETRIANALDVLARGKVDEDLWHWINDRNDDYTKTPAVSEQLDQLLKSLGRKSLKRRPPSVGGRSPPSPGSKLVRPQRSRCPWEDEDARHSSISESRPKPGKRDGMSRTPEAAMKNTAMRLIAWSLRAGRAGTPAAGPGEN